MYTRKTERDQLDQACRMAANFAKLAQQADRKDERDFYIKLHDDWMKLAKRIALSTSPAPLPPV